jgi:integrase
VNDSPSYRQREYLTEAEIDKLVTTAGDSRNRVRDRLLILMAFRHALRVSELVDLRWQQIHLDAATVDIRRAKNGTPGIHGLQGDELRLLMPTSGRWSGCFKRSRRSCKHGRSAPPVRLIKFSET